METVSKHTSARHWLCDLGQITLCLSFLASKVGLDTREVLTNPNVITNTHLPRLPRHRETQTMTQRQTAAGPLTQEPIGSPEAHTLKPPPLAGTLLVTVTNSRR